MAFYGMDPWGEQRGDLRMAKMVCAILSPHTKARLDPGDFMLFPDEEHDLPEGLDEQERVWKMRLDRLAG